MAADWLPVATLFAGLTGTFGGVALQSRSQRRRDEEARGSERAHRAADFQRQTLLDLQGAIARLLRCAVRTHLHDQKAFRETGGEYGRTLVGDELSVESGEAARLVSLLRERVQDSELRASTEALQGRCVEVVLYGQADALPTAVAQRAEAHFNETMSAGTTCRRLIGVRLRSLL